MDKRTTGDANEAMVEFLKADLDLAMTLVEIAASASEAERMERCYGDARKAYDTIRRMMNHVDLSKAEEAYILERLAKLKATLERVGESF